MKLMLVMHLLNMLSIGKMQEVTNDEKEISILRWVGTDKRAMEVVSVGSQGRELHRGKAWTTITDGGRAI